MDFESFYRRSIDDRDAFWTEQAALIDWHRAPTRICDYSNPPFARWYADGLTNLCHNAVDRHLAQRAGQAALIHVSTETVAEVTYSFAELHAEVQRMAAVLLSLGVGKGDRVLIYMPMIPQAVFAMLACARIGAIHSVVFGPRPRDFRKKVNRGTRRLALRKALSERLRAGDVVVVEELALASHRTKGFLGVLGHLQLGSGSTLVVVAENNRNLTLASRNIPDLELTTGSALNTYQVLRFDKLLFTRKAFEQVEQRLGA